MDSQIYKNAGASISSAFKEKGFSLSVVEPVLLKNILLVHLLLCLTIGYPQRLGICWLVSVNITTWGSFLICRWRFSLTLSRLVRCNPGSNSSDWLKADESLERSIYTLSKLCLLNHCVCHRVPHHFLFFQGWSDSLILLMWLLISGSVLVSFSKLFYHDPKSWMHLSSEVLWLCKQLFR